MTPQPILPPEPTPTPVNGDSLIRIGGLAGLVLIVLGLMGGGVLTIALGVLIGGSSIAGGIWWKQQDTNETIARADRVHRRQLELLRHDPSVLTAQTQVDIARIRAQTALDVQQAKEPTALRETALQLHQNLQTVLVAAWEKRDRDPAFADYFAKLPPLVSQANEATQRLYLDVTSGKDLTEDELQTRMAGAQELVIKLLDKLVNRL